MKKISWFFAILLVSTVLSPLMARVQADTPSYAFVIFETAVTRQGVETDDDHPEEQRVYVSNVVAFPEKDPSVFRSAMKLADDYFIATVVEPMKGKGILHQYYDDGIRINDKVTYDIDTRADVETLHSKVLQDLKERNNNVFTFTWTRTEEPNGLKSSHPTLFYHNPNQPLYLADTPPTDKATAPVALPAPAPPVAQAPPVEFIPTPTPKPAAKPKAPTALKKPVVSKQKVTMKPLATPKVKKLQSQIKGTVKKRPTNKPALLPRVTEPKRN